MSGIVGSKLNIRGSGRIAKLGTDGQVLTSAGAGQPCAFEDAAGGGTSWQSVETGATFTAVAGNGYPVNTTAQACTVTLPASASVGDTIQFIDYARKWGTNALTIDQNSLNFQGNTTPNPIYDTDGQSVTIVYADTTKGWIPTVDDDVALKLPIDVDIVVVAGGGSGGNTYGGGGGAGGLIYKTSHELTGTNVYDVVIGAGGAGKDYSVVGAAVGAVGVDTTWTINGGATEFTAKGGGGGGEQNTAAVDGGSGAGSGHNVNNASSETQTGQSGDSGTYGFGFDGGQGTAAPNYSPGGGGGAGSVGAAGTSTSGAGGTGKDLSAVFASEGDSGFFASGGGGGYSADGSSGAGSASSGGGTAGGTPSAGASSAAAANTGGGSGGGASGGGASGNGGSGVICFKVLTANYTGTVTGSPATREVGDYTIVEFTGDGSYTA